MNAVNWTENQWRIIRTLVIKIQIFTAHKKRVFTPALPNSVGMVGQLPNQRSSKKDFEDLTNSQ
jgi:hypothetical protein